MGPTTRKVTERLATFAAAGLTALPGAGYDGPDPLQPVFIVGSGRSGTTLVRRMLMAGSAIHIPPESYVMGSVVRMFAVWRLLPWPSTVRKVVRAFEEHPEFGRFEVSLRPVEAEMVSAGPASHTLASIIDAIYRHHSVERGTGTARWGDKTPRNSYFLPEIHRVFPNARFIHVLRDGCDVVASMVAMGRYPTVAQAARRWNTSLEAVHAFEVRHPGSVREVRYEDLVTDPASSLRPLCEWLGLEYRETMVTSHDAAERLGDVPARAHHRNVLSPVTTESIGRGRRDLNDPAARELQRLLGAHLEMAGYPPVASPGGGTAP